VAHVIRARGFRAAWDALGLGELVELEDLELEDLLPGLIRGR
jgi:hypothetical protein